MPKYTHKGQGAPRFKKAREAAKPGRYIAVIQGTAPNGVIVRRALTFYCLNRGQMPSVSALCDWMTRLPDWCDDKTAMEIDLQEQACQF